jgi:hypothetical protein
MISFKQFLLEGGKATADLGTVRANAYDIREALKKISTIIGKPEHELIDSLLGSTTHTLSGLKNDSGDIDIAFEDDDEKIVKKMEYALNQKAVKIGGNTFSFAVPTTGDRKVQVDFMFVPSKEWAKWMYHSDANSKHKGKIRNALLRAVAANNLETGKDLIIHDHNGNVVVRVRKSLKNDGGLVRLHKVALPRKDGKGRVKSLSDATKQQIEDAIGEHGVFTDSFTMDKDQVIDPNEVAEILFGKGTKAADLMSTEQVVQKILALPKDKAKKIVNDAIGHEMSLTELPKELKKFV